MNTDENDEFIRERSDTMIDHLMWNIEKVHRERFFDKRSGKEISFAQVTNSDWLVILIGMMSFLLELNWTLNMTKKELALKVGLPIREIDYWLAVFQAKDWLVKGPTMWDEDEECMTTMWAFTVGEPSYHFPQTPASNTFIAMLRKDNYI